MNENQTVLRYKESLLTKNDVELLEEPNWLNDNIITFYYEYLGELFLKSPHLLFVGPEVTQCIKLISPTQIHVLLDPLDGKNKKFTFFAFNDNDIATMNEGTHWSLVMYSRLDLEQPVKSVVSNLTFSTFPISKLQTRIKIENIQVMGDNQIVLSYKESLLRQSDVDLLKGPHWLNDNIITFYFEYLGEKFEKAPHILFVGPEVTQCIKLISSTQIPALLDPLDGKNKKFTFFAFNDNDVATMAGGTHWSLLLYSRLDQTVYYYDSQPWEENLDQAVAFAERLFAYYDVHGKFKQEKAVQQWNGHDCGVHLLANTECLATYLANSSALSNYVQLTSDVRNSVPGMRKKILDLICTLKERTSQEQ